MRRIVIMMVMMLGLGASAQEMTVKNMRWATNDMTACVHPRKDLNNTVCAVIKVIAPLKEMAFEGSIIGDVQYKTGEYWVYVTDNTRFLKIKHPLHEPLMVDFSTFECGRPKSKNTYELRIYTPNTAIAETVTGTSRSVESILAEVRDAYDKNNWERVRKLCLPISDNPEAQYYLGASLIVDGQNDKDYQQGHNLFRGLIESDNALGYLGLGVAYYYGRGVEKNQAEAYRWIRKAAEQNITEAQEFLALMYRFGIGTIQNLTEAFNWIRKAAEQGSVSAQYSLGVSYYQGIGIAKNKNEAYRWLKNAADQGNEDAKKYLKDNKF